MTDDAVDKSKKLLALALDLSGQPEGDVASVMFVKELKRSGVTLDQVIGGSAKKDPKPAAKAESGGLSDTVLKSLKFPFGKHKGEKIWDVAQDARDYVEWVSENITFREAKLNMAVKQILEETPDDESSRDPGDINLGD